MRSSGVCVYDNEKTFPRDEDGIGITVTHCDNQAHWVLSLEEAKQFVKDVNEAIKKTGNK